MTNIVFIATSLDGYIADREGGLDWLDIIPNPENDDGGFNALMDRVDAVVMGRVTFEAVVDFGIGWPYPKPGLILSSTVSEAPEGFEDHVEFAQGTPAEIVDTAGRMGFDSLYIDGGRTVQQFLQHDLIDELIITEVPILLGGGHRLFGTLEDSILWDLVGTEVLRDQLLQKRYRRPSSDGAV